jgi:hypothetical protein
MPGEGALCSSAALIFRKFVARSADNFAMKRRSTGRRFKSLLLHHPGSLISEIAENPAKSARVRAICDHAWIRRAPLSTRLARIGRFLSRRDLPRSAEYRF